MGDISLFFLYSTRQAIALLRIQLKFRVALLFGVELCQNLIVQTLMAFREDQDISAHFIACGVSSTKLWVLGLDSC